VLSASDVLLVTEVYAAGEAPIAGADGRAICRAVRSRGQVEPIFVEKVEQLGAALRDLLRPGDVVLTMGAGHIGAVVHELPKQLGAGSIVSPAPAVAAAASATAAAATPRRRKGDA
jgi:UDP-N-acetylmuramate--alanine ligase